MGIDRVQQARLGWLEAMMCFRIKLLLKRYKQPAWSLERFAGRVEDCKAKAVITCSAVMRGTKKIELKKITDDALAICSSEGYEVGFDQLGPDGCLAHSSALLGPLKSRLGH
eukprot:scaffold55079_cov32-Prasinocladus_malaysianus.AAC.1